MSRQHFDKTYGANAPENYERYFVPAIGEPLAKDLIRIAEIHPGERVLDVACGTGIVARLAAKEIGPDGSVSGLDVNPGMLAIARSIAPEGKHTEWYEASAEAIPCEDDVYDVVLCQMGLQFIEDKHVALQEMRRVLAPGGRLIINLPGPTSKVFAIVAAALEKYISAQAAGFVSHVFCLHDTEEIRRLISEAGFEDIVIRATSKALHLPAPKDFLWQYVYSTPLAAVVSDTDQKTLDALQKEIVGKWQEFTDSSSMKLTQRVVTASGRVI